eukprot:sb/3476180/
METAVYAQFHLSNTLLPCQREKSSSQVSHTDRLQHHVRGRERERVRERERERERGREREGKRDSAGCDIRELPVLQVGVCTVCIFSVVKQRGARGGVVGCSTMIGNGAIHHAMQPPESN